MEEEFQNRPLHLSSNETSFTAITPSIWCNLNLTATTPSRTTNGTKLEPADTKSRRHCTFHLNSITIIVPAYGCSEALLC